jgi:acyl-CoA thioester hydrolase
MNERELTSRDFPVHWPVLTRWTDNDMFGHLNNAVYYELFDTAINAWINTNTDVDPVSAPWLGVVAESGCRYFAELAFPDPLVVGLAVSRLGTVAAVGHWTHVYVDRTTRRPTPIPDDIRGLLSTAQVDG